MEVGQIPIILMERGIITEIKYWIYLIFFFVFVGCHQDNQPLREYNKFEKSLISKEYKNVWKLNPMFTIKEALQEASKSNQNVLILFTGLANSGNPRLVWELLDNKELSQIILDKEYLLCPLFTDIPYKLNDSDSFSLKRINSLLQQKYIGSLGTNWFQILKPNGEKCGESINIVSMSEQEKIIEFLKKNCL